MSTMNCETRYDTVWCVWNLNYRMRTNADRHTGLKFKNQKTSTFNTGHAGLFGELSISHVLGSCCLHGSDMVSVNFMIIFPQSTKRNGLHFDLNLNFQLNLTIWLLVISLEILTVYSVSCYVFGARLTVETYRGTKYL